MDDALLMSSLQSLRDLDGEVQHFIEGEGLGVGGVLLQNCQPVAQSAPVQQLHHDEGPALMFTEFINGADVGML